MRFFLLRDFFLFKFYRYVDNSMNIAYFSVVLKNRENDFFTRKMKIDAAEIKKWKLDFSCKLNWWINKILTPTDEPEPLLTSAGVSPSLWRDANVDMVFLTRSDAATSSPSVLRSDVFIVSLVNHFCYKNRNQLLKFVYLMRWSGDGGCRNQYPFKNPKIWSKVCKSEITPVS